MASHARRMSPHKTARHAVVMPHPGHSSPVREWNGHGMERPVMRIKAAYKKPMAAMAATTAAACMMRRLCIVVYVALCNGVGDNRETDQIEDQVQYALVFLRFPV